MKGRKSVLYYVFMFLLFISFFPIAITIVLIRNKRMSNKLKVGLIASIWILFSFSLFMDSPKQSNQSSQLTASISNPSISRNSEIESSPRENQETQSINQSNSSENSLIETQNKPEYSIDLNTVKNVIKYNTGIIDTLDLIEVSYGDTKWEKWNQDEIIVEPSIQSIDSSQLGKVTVDYTVSINDNSNNEKTFKRVFEVKDTDSPKLEIAESKVFVDNAGIFNVAENIKGIVDNNGEDFVLLDNVPDDDVDYNWYTYESDVNTSVVGLYTVKVIAGDSSGNRSAKTFKVNVNEPVVPEPVVQETYQEVTPQVSYILNTNTGVFHYSWCKSVSRMKEKNKWYYTGSRDEVINMGYRSCGNCNP